MVIHRGNKMPTQNIIDCDLKKLAEIIEHNETGLIFPKNNAKELAKAINYIASNPHKAQEWGENGFKRKGRAGLFGSILPHNGTFTKGVTAHK